MQGSGDSTTLRNTMASRSETFSGTNVEKTTTRRLFVRAVAIANRVSINVSTGGMVWGCCYS